MIVVSDTSPLCNLLLVDHLWLLQEIYGIVIIPNIVADELKAASNIEIQNICTLEWIETRSLFNPSFAERLHSERGLDLRIKLNLGSVPSYTIEFFLYLMKDDER